jgi:predicted nucleotide-binding protein
MARIDQQLLQRLRNKTGLGQSRVYALIDEKVRTAHLPRHLAAMAVAAERGVNISRFASADDLAAMRNSAVAQAPAPVIVPAAPRARAKSKGKDAPRRRGTSVFVVHGRDLAARDSIFAFLRSLALKPLEWNQALRLTKKGSPYVGEVLDAAFSEAAAIVVLLTPDDEARLKPEFRQPRDAAHERNLTGQARSNVLFEAGMAFGKNPNSTILVQLGDLRPFSDVGGRHVIHLSDNPASRQEFATKLANAGCNVDTSGTDWLTAGSFKRPAPHRAPGKRR